MSLAGSGRLTGESQREEKDVSKIVVLQFVTLDGVFEDPGGSESHEHGGWALQIDRGPEGDKFKLDEVMDSDALLLGRVTYEGFAEAWPSREGEFADKFNTMRKYVVSTTLKDPSWNNTTVIDGDVAEAVKQLRQEPGGDILVYATADPVYEPARKALGEDDRLMVYLLVVRSGISLSAYTGDTTTLRR